MKQKRMVLITVVLIATVMISCNLILPKTNDEPQVLPYIPVFDYPDVAKSRFFDANGLPDGEVYDEMFLPKLQGFISNTEGLTNEAQIEATLYGRATTADISFDEAGSCIFSFDFGDDLATCKITISPDNTFKYEQKVLISMINMDWYSQFNLSDGNIIEEDGAISFQGKGTSYISTLSEQSGHSFHDTYQIVKSTVYVKGTDQIIIGFPDPAMLSETYTLTEAARTDSVFFIADKELAELKISDFTTAWDLFESLDYPKYSGSSTNFPMNDIYHVVSDKSFHIYCLDNAQTAADFTQEIGSSYAELGYPEAIDTFDFFRLFFGFPYQNLSASEDWTQRQDGENTEYTIDFTVEETGAHYIHHSYDVYDGETKIDRFAFCELSAGTTYTLKRRNTTDYAYIMQLK